MGKSSIFVRDVPKWFKFKVFDAKSFKNSIEASLS